MTHISIKNFNPSKVVIGKIGDKKVTFYYPSNNSNDEFSKLRIQTPKLRIPFGMDEIKTADGTVFMKKISLSTNPLGDAKNKQKIDIFRQKISELDSKIVSLLPESHQLKHFYNSLYQGKNENYKPTMKLSIPYKNEKSAVPYFNQQNELIDESEVCQGKTIIAIIALEHLWISRDGSKMGVNWAIDQLKVCDEKIPEQTEFEEPAPPSVKKKFKFRAEN